MMNSGSGVWRGDAATGQAVVCRPEAFGLRGMVASAHPVAALTGMAVLQRGGNAFDATVAVAAAEGVLLPSSCGVGGDAFAVLYDAKLRQILALNGSGVAAAGATREYYISLGRKKMPLEGVHAVGVPGSVAVYETLWKNHGTLPWAELWAPAIRLAEEGLAVTEHVSRRFADRAAVLSRYPHSAKQFLPNGRPPAPGERWAAPNLARSLRAIADGGADSFYRGDLAAQLLEFLTSEGALFEANDFARQEAVVYTPITTEYRGVVVHETGPPSQGFLLLEQLNILEGYDLKTLAPLGTDRIHLFVEAKKLAFADRNRYAGDPDFVSWPLEQVISKEHAALRRAQIDRLRADIPGRGLVAETASDTSYFAVADGEGNAISFIHSLSGSFGSGVVAGETGITLNNRVGDGFSLEEGRPNVLAPGKRTMHTLNAYLVFRDGRPWLIGGTPGGDRQTQWNAQVITNLLDYGMGLQEAVDAPRWFSFPGTYPESIHEPFVVRLEQGIPETTRQELANRKHTVETIGPWPPSGAVQLIQLDHDRGVLRGASDPRAGGIALGY